MSQESQNKPGRNTKMSRPASHQARRWKFVLKADEPNSYSPQELFEILKPICTEFYYQMESGEETGYIHYDGCFSLKSKEYFNTVKNLIGQNDVHLEQPINWKACVAYAQKMDTRIGGPWNHNSVWIKTIQHLLPWQEELHTELSQEPDDRKVIWYCDWEGGTGKTSFAKYMAVHHHATVMTNAKSNDIAYGLPDHPKIVIFNLTRSSQDHINYEAIEAIKDGLIFSGKYESKTKVFNSPHVVIFANKLPDKQKLSADRWDIREMGEEPMNDEHPDL